MTALQSKMFTKVLERIQHDIRNPYTAVYGYLTLAVDHNEEINTHPRVLQHLKEKMDAVSEAYKSIEDRISNELQSGTEEDFERRLFQLQMHACAQSRMIKELVTQIHSEVQQRSTKVERGENKTMERILSQIPLATDAMHDAILSTIPRKHKPVDINELIQNLEGITHHNLSTERLQVIGDHARLVTAFANIVANAKDFERPGVEPMRLVTSEVLPESPDEVHIHFMDRGTGIPADVLPHIFEYKFTTRSGQGGTGLGLDTARHIVVEEHGGRISAQSEPGHWTNFHIVLQRHLPLRKRG